MTKKGFIIEHAPRELRQRILRNNMNDNSIWSQVDISYDHDRFTISGHNAQIALDDLPLNIIIYRL